MGCNSGGLRGSQAAADRGAEGTAQGAHSRNPMAPPRPEPVVNSFNEWDPLEEVLVGSLEGAVVPPWEAGFDAIVAREHTAEARHHHQEHVGKRHSGTLVEAAQAELEGLVKLLEAEGVVVRRPERVDHARPFATPYWSGTCGNAQVNPRDLLIVIGDEIIEAPMAWRSRYFEFLGYRKLVKEYFSRGARWTAAPKPELCDETYREDWRNSGPGSFVISEHEPLFEAADMARCGRDIFIQRSHVTNRMGIEWMRRHLGSEYRLHPVEFDDYRAIHIDSTFVPLAPGKLMVNPARPLRAVPEVLAGSRWEIRQAPPSTLPRDFPWYHSLRWLSLNVLSLDEKRVLVEAGEIPLMRFLEDWGFEPIPVPFSHNYLFGGGLHCATVDIRRHGGLQEYF